MRVLKLVSSTLNPSTVGPEDSNSNEALITEIFELSLRANLRTLVYLLSIAKVAAAEARRSKSEDGNGSFARAQPS